MRYVNAFASQGLDLHMPYVNGFVSHGLHLHMPYINAYNQTYWIYMPYVIAFDSNRFDLYALCKCL